VAYDQLLSSLKSLSRISRIDIDDSDEFGVESIKENSSFEEAFRQQSKLGNSPFTSQINVVSTPQEAPVEVFEDAVEFRLFAGSKSTKPIKIRIKSPEVGESPLGFVVPDRPQSYYFRNGITKEENFEYQHSAVSGEDIIIRSKIKWPGCSLPWRVITGNQRLNAKAQSHTTNFSNGDTVSKDKHTKISKRTRIAKRMKLAAIEKRNQENHAAAIDREERLRKKKSKKNRAQKLKKREKERAKKIIVEALDNESEKKPDENL